MACGVWRAAPEPAAWRRCTWTRVLATIGVSGVASDASAAAVEPVADVLRLLPPAAQVWAVDADASIVCPGSRLVDGIELLPGVPHLDRWPAAPANHLIRLR
jgi:hypothetical protein